MSEVRVVSCPIFALSISLAMFCGCTSDGTIAEGSQLAAAHRQDLAGTWQLTRTSAQGWSEEKYSSDSGDGVSYWLFTRDQWVWYSFDTNYVDSQLCFYTHDFDVTVRGSELHISGGFLSSDVVSYIIRWTFIGDTLVVTTESRARPEAPKTSWRMAGRAYLVPADTFAAGERCEWCSTGVVPRVGARPGSVFGLWRVVWSEETYYGGYAYDSTFADPTTYIRFALDTNGTDSAWEYTRPEFPYAACYDGVGDAFWLDGAALEWSRFTGCDTSRLFSVRTCSRTEALLDGEKLVLRSSVTRATDSSSVFIKGGMEFERTYERYNGDFPPAGWPAQACSSR